MAILNYRPEMGGEMGNPDFSGFNFPVFGGVPGVIGSGMGPTDAGGGSGGGAGGNKMLRRAQGGTPMTPQLIGAGRGIDPARGGISMFPVGIAGGRDPISARAGYGMRLDAHMDHLRRRFPVDKDKIDMDRPRQMQQGGDVLYKAAELQSVDPRFMPGVPLGQYARKKKKTTDWYQSMEEGGEVAGAGADSAIIRQLFDKYQGADTESLLPDFYQVMLAQSGGEIPTAAIGPRSPFKPMKIVSIPGIGKVLLGDKGSGVFEKGKHGQFVGPRIDIPVRTKKEMESDKLNRHVDVEGHRTQLSGFIAGNPKLDPKGGGRLGFFTNKPIVPFTGRPISKGGEGSSIGNTGSSFPGIGGPFGVGGIATPGLTPGIGDFVSGGPQSPSPLFQSSPDLSGSSGGLPGDFFGQFNYPGITSPFVDIGFGPEGSLDENLGSLAKSFQSGGEVDPALQGKERENEPITPEEMDAIYRAREKESERSRKRAMNEPTEMRITMQKGGRVMKKKNTDSVPIMATPGEFMLNRGAVETAGRPFLHWLNELGKSHPVMMQEGGSVAVNKKKMFPIQGG